MSVSSHVGYGLWSKEENVMGEQRRRIVWSLKMEVEHDQAGVELHAA
jgi:hypothetical protein